MFDQQLELKGTTFDIATTLSEKYYGYPRSDNGVIFVMDGLLQLSNWNRVVNRGLEEPIDVLFVAEDGRVNSVKHLTPADSILSQFRLWYDSVYGQGRYVIEAPEGWADEHGITEGDTLSIPSHIE